MACEDGDAKVKGKLPGVGSADRRESCWLTRSKCPLSLSMALANPAPFLLFFIDFLLDYSTYVCLSSAHGTLLPRSLPALASESESQIKSIELAFSKAGIPPRRKPSRPLFFRIQVVVELGIINGSASRSSRINNQ